MEQKTQTITKTQDLLKLLNHLSEKHPHHVTSKINQGDLIKKSMGLFYEIDDPDIKPILSQVPGNGIYSKVYNHFWKFGSKVTDLFKDATRQNGKSVIPYSVAVNNRAGECLEKSVAFQLANQNRTNCFMISGSLMEDINDFANFHAYNIAQKDDRLYLVDCENPLVPSNDQGIIPNEEKYIFEDNIEIKCCG